jgi:hypothetical protein
MNRKQAIKTITAALVARKFNCLPYGMTTTEIATILVDLGITDNDAFADTDVAEFLHEYGYEIDNSDDPIIDDDEWDQLEDDETDDDDLDDDQPVESDVLDQVAELL